MHKIHLITTIKICSENNVTIEEKKDIHKIYLIF